MVTSVCVCCLLVRVRMPIYCTDPDVTWGSGRGCPLVVHYSVDLQSVPMVTVLDGDPAPPPQFSAHVYCGQTA